MASYYHKNRGTCSQGVEFDIQDGKVLNVHFIRGCSGNLQGISHLVEGMDAQEVISRLRGFNCGGKGTSCPDQLAQALEEILEKQ